MNKNHKIFLLSVMCFFFICTTFISSFVAVHYRKELENPEYGYIKFQDRMSMDWDGDDSELLMKIAEYHGGRLEDRAYTIIITLNKCVEKEVPIREIVETEMKKDGVSEEEFENITISNLSKSALSLVMIDRWDETNGADNYREFYKEDME